MVPPLQPLFQCPETGCPSSWECDSFVLASSLLASSSLCHYCCASLHLASLSSLLCWISAAVFPSSNLGTLAVGTPIFVSLLPFFCPLSNNKQQRFHKKKILKYKVSQVQLKTALDNCKKKTPILETMSDAIHQMPDSKWCTAQTDSPYIVTDCYQQTSHGS